MFYSPTQQLILIPLIKVKIFFLYPTQVAHEVVLQPLRHIKQLSPWERTKRVYPPNLPFGKVFLEALTNVRHRLYAKLSPMNHRDRCLLSFFLPGSYRWRKEVTRLAIADFGFDVLPLHLINNNRLWTIKNINVTK